MPYEDSVGLALAACAQKKPAFGFSDLGFGGLGSLIATSMHVLITAHFGLS